MLVLTMNILDEVVVTIPSGEKLTVRILDRRRVSFDGPREVYDVRRVKPPKARRPPKPRG